MTRILVRLALLAAISAVLVTTLPGDVPCCELRYTLSPDPENAAVDVELELHGFLGDSLVLVRPSTRPLTGLLNQDPHVDGIRRVHWSLVDGAPRWAFDRPEAGWPDPVVIRYRLSIPAERPVNAWSVGLDDDLLYAPAEGLFLTPAMGEVAAQNARVHVEWDLPPGWDAFAGWSGASFHGVRNLLKTNVLAGEIGFYRASACGLEVELGVHGQWTFAPESLASDLARLACAARARLGEPKARRYAVTLVQARFPMTSGNRNGPHTIGFVHDVPGGAPPSTRLLAHEMVHLWQRFDAPQWFQEGVNDYMAVRLASEAGLFDDDRFLGHLAAIDSVYRAHPRRGTWSFADEEEHAPPFGPSDEYLAYRKGALVGLALDRELRLRTGGEADLAALWRSMNAQARWGRVQWSDEGISARAAALAGGSVDRFWGLYVDGVAPLPAPSALAANLPPPAAPDLADRASAAALLQALIARIGS